MESTAERRVVLGLYLALQRAYPFVSLSGRGSHVEGQLLRRQGSSLRLELRIRVYRESGFPRAVQPEAERSGGDLFFVAFHAL